MMQPIHPNPA